MSYIFKLGRVDKILEDGQLAKVNAVVLCEKSDAGGFVRKSQMNVIVASSDVVSFTQTNVKQAIISKMTDNSITPTLAQQMKNRADIAPIVETREEFSVSNNSLNID